MNLTNQECTVDDSEGENLSCSVSPSLPLRSSELITREADLTQDMSQITGGDMSEITTLSELGGGHGSRSEESGLLTKSLRQMFEQVKELEETESRMFVIKCSYFEIYND
jgi:hypothetical protein